MNIRTSATFFAAALALFILPHAASAQVAHPFTWDGGSLVDSNWSTKENWVGDVVITETSSFDRDVIFGGSNRLTPIFNSSAFGSLSGGFNLRGITFDATAAAFTLTETASAGLDMLGDRNTATTSNIVNNSTNLQTISLKLFIRQDFTSGLNFNTASGDISVTTGMVQSGTGAVIKTGAATLLLSGANVYTGPTTITGGSVTVSGSGRLGSGQTSLASTAITLAISTGATDAIPNAATLSLAGGGTLDVADAGFLTLGTGVNESVATLILGGTPMTPGTYGAVGSGAGFQSNEFFSGSGVLTVTAPEPGSALTLVAGIGLLLRRSRQAR